MEIKNFWPSMLLKGGPKNILLTFYMYLCLSVGKVFRFQICLKFFINVMALVFHFWEDLSCTFTGIATLKCSFKVVLDTAVL